MKCIYLYRHDDVRHTIEEKKMQHVCAVGSDSTYKIHVPFHGPSSSGARVTRENLKPECFSCTLDSGCGGIHLVYFSLGTASLWSVVSPLARTHRHLRFHKAGAPHPRPQEGRPPPAHGPRLAPCRLTGSSHAPGSSTRGRNPLPLARSTRPRRKHECLHRKPPRLEPGAHPRPPTLPAAGPKPCGRPRVLDRHPDPSRGGSYRRTGGGGFRSRRRRSSSFWKRTAARKVFTPRTGGARAGAAGARRQRGPRSSSLPSPEAIAGAKARVGGRRSGGSVSR